MTADPIQRLRSRQCAAQIERPWRYDETSQCIYDANDTPVCDAISRVEGRYIVALCNVAPALLAVAEAARVIRDKGYHLHKPWATDYDAVRRDEHAILDHLAKLYEVAKP